MAAQESESRISAAANAFMRAQFTGGRLKSLKATGIKAVEFISPEAPFGDITLTVLQNGGQHVLSTVGATPDTQGDWAVFHFGMLDAAIRFALAGDRLTYLIRILSTGKEMLTVLDLAVFFPMNSRFEWGVKAQERVIRHSFVCGDGSFLYFTPCDGEPPYLACCPHRGTRLEMYDARVEVGSQPVYRAFIHAAGECKAAAGHGCTWRQPVSDRDLQPGESYLYGFDFQFARDYDGVRDILFANGKPDILLAPGMTIPRNTPVRMRVRLKDEITALEAEYPDETAVLALSREHESVLFEIAFARLGENRLTLRYGGGQYSVLEFFVTLPVEKMIALRGAFISARQIRDESLWYNGLLAEWNNETGAVLTPDHYDLIRGWRIYEVTCDDPGLSKPAFLAAKNAEYPVKEEVAALEYYIARFVWGGLQRRGDEEYPYGIYGIPDWKTLRESPDPDKKGRAHLWRIYDYPHLGLVYYCLYRIGKAYPGMLEMETAMTYLDRAYRTFLALYQYPPEIDDWSPYKTGLYNELVMEGVIGALAREGRQEAAQRLTAHWQRKAKYFITACEDVFGSEYPFDTTGYETTQALADYARRTAPGEWKEDRHHGPDYTVGQAEQFAAYQTQCNIACRGVMEHAYYLLGSDYRGCSAHYTLSYMSQMGGWSLLQHALYTAEDPFKLLRLAYASLLSSWALLNAGDTQGYWFPGTEHNGAAGGGFENAPYGKTWLDQPHHRGSWYYSCEIDLGFCGALRGAAVILADDPDLGTVCYGGKHIDGTILPADGLHKRFHHIQKDARLHVLLENARFSQINISPDGYEVQLCGIARDAGAEISHSGGGTIASIQVDETEFMDTATCSAQCVIPAGAAVLRIRLAKEKENEGC